MSPPRYTPIGLWKTFYYNHQLKDVGNYNQKGKKTGTWYYYDFEGNLINTQTYKKSDDVNCKCKHEPLSPYH